jgi:hyperpolarization activated cyclic nucleotide-gated potassium channel 2
MLYFNNTISDFGEILSSIEIIDNYSSFILSAFIMFIILNMTTCLFIFLGNNSYPNWIIKINMQNENYSVQYLTSIYFIIVTITTVGYGDITGLSSSEIGFQIYLLIIGTIAYSFTISYISNQIVKINQRSMNFEKNMDIINEIKLHNPCMNDCLYNEVVRNINNMKLYEKKR